MSFPLISMLIFSQVKKALFVKEGVIEFRNDLLSIEPRLVIY